MSKPLAVVSGGTKGIGLALSLRLIALGHNVIALYRADELAAKQAAEHEHLLPLKVDLAQPREIRSACERILGEHGTVRVLVNNAGVNRDRSFLELSEQDWDEVLATNLSGPFHLSRALAPAMVEQGAGVIVNIGATTAIRPRRDGANYCASKAGLLQLTKCMALELAPHVRVNALLPGFTDTAEVTERYRLDDPDRLSEVLQRIPQGRIGGTQDIADALEYLVTARSAYVTGQQLIVDGGHFMG